MVLVDYTKVSPLSICSSVKIFIVLRLNITYNKLLVSAFE